jgi:hypothetical protein
VFSPVFERKAERVELVLRQKADQVVAALQLHEEGVGDEAEATEGVEVAGLLKRFHCEKVAALLNNSRMESPALFATVTPRNGVD